MGCSAGAPPGLVEHGKNNTKKETLMEGIFFLVLWIGAAALHTIFDLKVRPHLARMMDHWGEA